MSISTPPPPVAPKKQQGLGCFGCGCLVLVIIGLLIAGLFGVGSYFGYHKLLAYTSDAPANITMTPATDDFYESVRHKAADFNHDVQNNQPASIQLSGDEINAILQRDPYLSAHHIQIVVAIDGDQASIQGSAPLDAIPVYGSFFAGRYANFNATLGLNYDTATKMIQPLLQSVQIGGQTLPPEQLPLLQTQLMVILNSQLTQNPAAQKLLNQAKSIRLENGNLVIETQ